MFVSLRNAKESVRRTNFVEYGYKQLTFKHMALVTIKSCHMQMRVAGLPYFIATCFVIFSGYFICKIVNGVRKVSSHSFKMRQGYLSTPYW